MKTSTPMMMMKVIKTSRWDKEDEEAQGFVQVRAPGADKVSKARENSGH